MLLLFRIFLNIHDFFDFCVVFLYKAWLYGETQPRVNHHKILRKISDRTVHVRSRGSTRENGFIAKYDQQCYFMWVLIA